MRLALGLVGSHHKRFIVNFGVRFQSDFECYERRPPIVIGGNGGARLCALAHCRDPR
jgi:hypothetical protein